MIKRLYYFDGVENPITSDKGALKHFHYVVKIREDKKYSGSKVFLLVIITSVLASFFSVLVKVFQH